MTPRSPRRPGPPVALVLTAVLTGSLLGGCGPDRPAATGAAVRLVAFASCDDLLRGLRRAVHPALGPYGVGDVARGPLPQAADAAPAAGGAARQAEGAPVARLGTAPAFSGTNTREAGVDEPDLVKTDGRRIVTVHAGVLRVVDAATRRFTGSLDLRGVGSEPVPQGDLLLSGDHALVLQPGYGYGWSEAGVGPAGLPPGRPGLPPAPDRIAGPRLLLVDLSGAPRLLGTYEMDGNLLDARMVGSTVRVVTRSAPRLRVPAGEATPGGAPGAVTGVPDAVPGGLAGDAARTAANRAAVDAAGPDDWLPRYRTSAGPHSVTGRVSCAAVSVPASYSALSMITITTFDLRRNALGSGDPVTVVADADLVYATGTSLYLAGTTVTGRTGIGGRTGAAAPTVGSRTDIYRFDTGGERPVFRSAGSVPGRPVNQYALDEWGGTLRVATTTDGVIGPDVPLAAGGDSAVYVLRERGDRLRVTGHVGGLGRGERIYAVRFAGPTGYVVTFRQTDPLYTVDLSDPDRPRVRGELALTGYSAYLHPLDGHRLAGIGQEASAQGRALGTQLSLFDVSDPGAPRLLDRRHLPSAWSQAEQDPHAFLYWPATGLLVVPVSAPGTAGEPRALALRVGARSLGDLGEVAQPSAAGGITRSLVVDRTLWTLSDAGLSGNDLDSLAPVAWLPF